MDIKLTDTEDAFDLPEWRELLAEARSRHIFATPEWNRTWWEEFGTGHRLLVLTFLDPHPVGIAPLMFDPRSGRVSFLADDESLTDYLGPLVLEHERLPALAGALLEYLRDEVPGWRCFDANCLPVPFHFAEWLVEAADRLGFKFSLDQHEMTAVLPLPASWESYVEHLKPKQRHELRRKLRRLERAGEPPRVVTADARTLAADLDTFVALHRGSEGLKGKFMLPERATFFARLAHAFLPLGFLSLDFLEVGGDRFASTFSFSFDGSFYLYNSAYDHAHRQLSPGLALVALLIQRSIRRGLRHFDFLRGRERYKFDLGAEPVPLHAVRISRPPRAAVRKSSGQRPG